MSNIQNKVCSFNIIMNGLLLNPNKIPILYRISEDSDRTINDIIRDNKDIIMSMIENDCKTVDDYTSIYAQAIVYDINNDTYDTDTVNITNIIDDKSFIDNILVDKINEYSSSLLKKMNINDDVDYIKAYEIINEKNNGNIFPITYINYIIMCFSKEYADSKYSNVKHMLLNILQENIK